jgi:hypothetical protein
VKNRRTAAFNKIYQGMTSGERTAVEYAYTKYKTNPQSVDFEQKGRLKNGIPVFGAAITGNLRALALVVDETVHWYWLGPHDVYDRMLKSLRK